MMKSREITVEDAALCEDGRTVLLYGRQCGSNAIYTQSFTANGTVSGDLSTEAWADRACPDKWRRVDMSEKELFDWAVSEIGKLTEELAASGVSHADISIALVGAAIAHSAAEAGPETVVAAIKEQAFRVHGNVMKS